MKTAFGLTILIAGIFFLGFTCSNTESSNSRSKVVIHTPYGDMVVELYDETPGHRDNFLKLVREGYYDSLLFHRVIKNFMIQGGDPDSRNAPSGARLGNGSPGYELDPEFIDTLIHRKGALAAARNPDNVNPTRKSSGSQFYIVQGKTFSPEELRSMEERRKMQNQQYEFARVMSKPENDSIKQAYTNAMKTGNRELGIQIIQQFEPQLKEALDKYRFSDEDARIYESVGGAPHLDDAYTVFGQLIEGFDVLDSIASVQTDPNNRPLEDVIMIIEELD